MTDAHVGDDRAARQPAANGAEAPTIMVPTARITVVKCAADHVLGGLFVLFRPIATGPLAGLTSSTWHLGLTTRDEGWLGPADAMEFLPWDPALYGPMNFSEVVPDTYKLVPDQTYEVYFIQHPGLEKARQIAREISAGARPHGEPQRIQAGHGILTVPEAASSFIPKGGQLYQGFILYRDMPHASCQETRAQVRRLQAHLGAMRYLIGTSNFPYLPDVGSDGDTSGGVNEGIFDVRTMGAVYRFQKDVNARSAFQVDGDPHAAYVDHNYDPVVDRNKLEALQADVRAKRKLKSPGKHAPQSDQDAYRAARAEAVRLDKQAAVEKEHVAAAKGVRNAWAYLSGNTVPAPAGPDLAADGVVDADTANAIKAWLDAKLRKPGMILVLLVDPRTWSNWLRFDAAMALQAFHELAKAMGFPYGVCVNHTFRSAQVDVGHAGYGRSARSIHKTGAAIDLGMANFSETVEEFPVIYEHEVDEDKARGPLVRWRLHGPSQQPISSERDQAIARAKPLIDRLEALAAGDEPYPHAFDQLHAIASRLAKEATADAVAFFKKYYHATVRRWNYDAFHPDGGTPGLPITADEEANRRIAARDSRIAKLQVEQDSAQRDKTQDSIAHERRERARTNELRSSFLDLTALAGACGLEPIHAFKSGWGQTTKSVKAADLTNLAKLLDAAAESLSQHPDMRDTVVVARKNATYKTTVAAIDKDFVASWASALRSLKKEAPRSVKANPPQIVVTLSHTDDKKQDASRIAAKLREFGSRQLAGLVCVDGTPPVQAASDWAQYIDDRVRTLDETWRAMQAPPSGTRGAGSTRVPSKKPVAPQSVLILQPIFLKDFKLSAGRDVKDAVWFLPGDLVELPAHGQPIGMEWWHFQLESVLVAKPVHVTTHRRWGDLLVEIGYERDVLRHGASPVLHYREGIGYPDADLDDAKAY